MSHFFTVYIDESGDEGFVFRDPPNKGSSDWFIVSAVVTFSSDQKQVIEAASRIRKALGMLRNAPLHFVDMAHERRVRAIRELVSEKVRFVSIAVDKRSIDFPDTFTAQRGRLYYYAVRLLLERVSWLCRDTARKNSSPTRAARIVVEHRKRLKHEDLVGYINTLKHIDSSSQWLAASSSDINIDWGVVKPELMETAQKNQYAGLQFADFVASGLKKALRQASTV